MASYGYTYEEACAWDGTGFAEGAFADFGGTIGAICGCSCADPVPTCEGTEVVVDGGSFQSEVSWTISDCDGNAVASGGAPYAGCIDLPDAYTISMEDSWGDGWNGNAMTIGDASYTLDGIADDGTAATVAVGECEVIEDPVALFYSEYAEGLSLIHI